MVRYLAPVMAFCLLGHMTLTAAPAAAQQQQQQLQNITKTTNGAWTLECGTVPANGQRICQMSQFANDPQTNKPVIQAAVLQPPGAQNAILRLIAPLGVWLRPGVELSIDGGQPNKLNFEFCLREGCIAQLPMTPGLVAAMKKGKAANLTLRNIRRQQVSLSVSLSGFTKSFNGLSG